MMNRLFASWTRLFVIAAFVALATLVPAVALAQITFLNTWGSNGSGNGQFQAPTAVAVGPTGTVYVTDFGNNRVEAFGSSGAFESSFGSEGSGNGQLIGPAGIAVNSTGTVFVADSDNNRIEVFNSAGNYQSSFGSEGSGNGQFGIPEKVAVGPTGTVNVADRNNNRIEVFSSAGVFESSFGSEGSGSGQFTSPTGVAVSSTGAIYVADTGNNRIEVFDSAGNYQSSFGSEGVGNGQFFNPNSVAVGSTGLVYVADSGNNRIEVFNSAGVFQSSIGSVGSGNGQFYNPSSIAVSPTGMIYVGDQFNIRVVRLFDPASWVSGTNTFTDSSVGPISVTVGPGQMMGTSLTMTSAMGLVVGGSVTVNSGGTLTQAGGSITAANPITISAGGNFTYQSGSLNVSEIDVSGFFQATQGGQLTLSAGLAEGGNSGAETLLDGGTSLSCGTVSMQSGLLAIGNATVSVTGSTPFRIFGGEVQLQNANTSIINSAQVLVEGTSGPALLDGSGRINGQLQNYTGGEVSVASGQTMTITGAGSYNSGLMSLTGGTLHFTQDLTNYSPGSIEGIGTLRVDGGLTNNSMLALAGSSYVFGTVNNTSSGTIHLSGSAPNIFFGAITNNGAINIDAGASGLFYGGLSGSGNVNNFGEALLAVNSTAAAVSGSGSLDIESAATLNANTVSQGALSLQLGGDTTGSYSKLDVAGGLSLSGKLTVSLVNGFSPSLGNGFDLLDWGSISGHFSSVGLPALSAGLAWNSTQLYTTGVLAVVSTNFLPGDFNRDGHVDAADILPAMKALTDPVGYEAQYGVSAADLQIIGDVNGDTKFTNADLQGLLDYLKDGGGSISTVPEPASWFLASLAMVAVLCGGPGHSLRRSFG
jgi:hypothetical protein